MISPSKALASATESAVLPLAVGPPTATTRGLDKSAKLLFQLLPGDFQYAGPPVRAERRDRAVHDALGQREHLGGVRAVPRFDGRAAGDGMQHPLGLFTQGVASAVGELCRQLHDHILYIVHRHVRGHGAHNNSRAAEVLGLDAGIGQKVKVLQNGQFFRAVRLTCTGTSSIWDGTLP